MRPTIEALRTSGARVEVRTDGTEVLEYLRNHKTDPPDVLILDIMMPAGAEMNPMDGGRTTGIEVYKWMQKEKIRIPTVVSTIVNDASILRIFGDHNVPIVEKPYRFEELEREIHKVLAERERR
jgi:CheY-like chemotaxis protein